MASRDVRDRATPGALLGTGSADALLDAGATRLSWALGEQVLATSDPDRAFDCEHATSAARVTAFDATDATHLLRVRTPVGRERFYELPSESVEEWVGALAEDSAWQVATGTAGRNA